MNRQIKFRVWNKPAKCFIQDINNEIATFTLLTLSDYLKEYSISNIDHLIFQQYTGLNDANDNPICEGDILKIDYDTFGNVIGQVLYETDQGAYILQWKRTGPNQNYINLNCDVAFESVIVGNIFEHKHLLLK